MGSLRRLLSLLAALVLLPGCVGIVAGTAVDEIGNAVAYPFHEYLFAGVYTYDNDPDRPWVALEDTQGRDYGEELLGVAVSGGGSRSAYFLACVLDEMRHLPAPGGPDGRTLLDEVDFLSSVSGGSLSSTYYTLHRPKGSDGADLDRFFARYREEMRKDFELRSLGRAVFLFRWLPLLFTRYDRAHLVASTWDGNFFGDRTFADLPPPGDGTPSLIINATSYTSGNRFVFTRLPYDDFRRSGVFRALPDSVLHHGGADARHRAFYTAGFDSIDSDIGSYPLSMAVAASASVPGLLGPVTLKDRTTEGRMEALGDGGVYDNYGLESLVALFATILEERPGLRARILVVDGSGYFPAYEDFSNPVLGDYVDRMSSISFHRAAGSSSLIFGLLARTTVEEVTNAEGESRSVAHVGVGSKDSPFRNLVFQGVSLYHARSAEDLRRDAEEDRGGWLAGLLTGRPIFEALATYNQRVRGIGTRFKISSDDAAVVENQARAAVRDVLVGDPWMRAASATGDAPGAGR